MTKGPVDKLLEEHDWSGRPDELMAQLCRNLLEESGSSVPVNVKALASFRGAVVEETEQDVDGWIGPDGDRLVIRVRSSDLEVRKRFTVCHEVCHTFFPDFREVPRTRTEPDVERFDERDPVEFLCDVGAAELLLPRLPFELLLPEAFSIDAVLGLAEHFRASIEATARRAVLLSDEPVSATVLEPRGTSDRLSVRWSVARHIPAAARGACISSASPLADVPEGTGLRFTGETGLLPGRYEAEARLLPYPRAGRSVARVLVLIR